MENKLIKLDNLSASDLNGKPVRAQFKGGDITQIWIEGVFK